MSVKHISSFHLFPIASYSQETDRWIDSHQEGYNQPMMDEATQKRYVEKLRQRLYGSSSPWDEYYVQEILQEDMRRCAEKALSRFSNDGTTEQNKWYGMNFRPYSSRWIENIRNIMPLDELNKQTFHTTRRAIAIANLTARVLPSHDICLEKILSGCKYFFDYLQASAVFIGTPVYRIIETNDKMWSLVVTPDFIAWVPRNGLAYVDDIFIRGWSKAANENLAAIIQNGVPLVNANGIGITQAHIGSIFPVARYAHIETNELILKVPVANEKHEACLIDITVPSTDIACIPIQTSRKNFAKIIDVLKGRNYDWGGKAFYNDCSAELKALFLPFGIWLPRNSSDQVDISEKVDISDASPEERLTYLKEFGEPFLTIVYIGGHVFLYIGTFSSHSSETPIAMSYQNIWGMSHLSGDIISIIGEAVFLPLLNNYPEDPNLSSLLEHSFFQIAYLKRIPEGYPRLKKPGIMRLSP